MGFSPLPQPPATRDRPACAYCGTQTAPRCSRTKTSRAGAAGSNPAACARLEPSGLCQGAAPTAGDGNRELGMATGNFRVVLDTNEVVGAGTGWMDHGTPMPDPNTCRRVLIRVAESHKGLYCGKIVG